MSQKNKKNDSVEFWMSLAVTRILVGFVFLWAFLDKSFGLGFSTSTERAWINGGSPTAGYLSGLDGVFASFFNSLAGNSFVDVIFMLGLFGVGVGLVLGVAMRISIVSGAAMLFLMWLAALPLSTNPLVDDHIVYIAILVVLWLSPSVPRLSLADNWRTVSYVKNNSWLQ